MKNNIRKESSDKFNNIVKRISKSIFCGEKITQKLVFHFMNTFVCNINSIDEDQLKLYHTMRQYLYEMWQYREWENFSTEQAFLYGQIYGCVKLHETKEEYINESLWINSMVKKYKDHKLFLIVKNNPGISFEELARNLNISLEKLSEIMNDDDVNKLLTFGYIGNKKHYFLTTKGELLIELILNNE